MPAHHRTMTVAAVLVAATGLLLSTATAGNATTVATSTRHDRVQHALADLADDGRFPGTLAAVRDENGRTRNYVAGVADLTTHAPVPVDGLVRIGSNTKPFASVVVLQLVDEGKIVLDAPIETYLPGRLRGDGIDGRRITVRQLLQHTSGLPDYVDGLGGTFAELQHTYFSPDDLLRQALTEPARFAPGTRWEYSNTNYVVAGLMIEKVTGNSVRSEITNRVIRRIGLRHTYFPAPREEGFRGPHPHSYLQETEDSPLLDVTVLDPSWGWAAGAMIASPSDVNRFFVALLDGKLLKPAQLRQMRATVDAASGLWPGARYGLGLISTPLSCGGLAWGHGGDIPGYETRNAATDDGRAVTVAVTAPPTTEESAEEVRAVVDLGLCGQDRRH